METTLAKRLSTRSKKLFYNVYTFFDWPETLPQNEYWLSPELLTIHGTDYFEQAKEKDIIRLSQLETINLFSIFAHGEKSLLQTILKNVHSAEMESVNEYLIHFIDEENKHMWFFSEFCKRYHGNILPSRLLNIPSKFQPNVEQFLSFIRILLFEEIGDYFNVNVVNDQRIPGFVRSIHERHHADESGHIAIGWEILGKLIKTVADEPKNVIAAIEEHIESYMISSLQNLYNPDLYVIVNFSDPYEMRRNLINSPKRDMVHERILKRSRKKLARLFEGIK